LRCYTVHAHGEHEDNVIGSHATGIFQVPRTPRKPEIQLNFTTSSLSSPTDAFSEF
jgi:hypothetical protein